MPLTCVFAARMAAMAAGAIDARLSCLVLSYVRTQIMCAPSLMRTEVLLGIDHGSRSVRRNAAEAPAQHRLGVVDPHGPDQLPARVTLETCG